MRTICAMVALLALLLCAPAFANPQSEDCARIFSSLEQFIFDHTPCTKTSDCKAPFLGCPFGCGTAVNQSFNQGEFYVMKRMYENECGVCKYDCQRQTKTLRCMNNKCVLAYDNEWQDAEDAYIKEITPEELY